MLLILGPHRGFADGFSPGVCPSAALAGSQDIRYSRDVRCSWEVRYSQDNEWKGEGTAPTARCHGAEAAGPPCPRGGQGMGRRGHRGGRAPPRQGCRQVAAGTAAPTGACWHFGPRGSRWQGSSESAQDGCKTGGCFGGPTAPPVPCHFPLVMVPKGKAPSITQAAF